MRNATTRIESEGPKSTLSAQPCSPDPQPRQLFAPLSSPRRGVHRYYSLAVRGLWTDHKRAARLALSLPIDPCGCVRSVAVRTVTGGRAPPLVCEVEKECLRRAHKRFEERIPSLTSRLGQMVEPINPSALELWNSLQALNPLREILRMLSEQFKISLLADYLCLQPWPLHD